MADKGPGESSVAESQRELFGKVGVDRARQVLGALLESPFLYRSDDPDLFGVLTRNQRLFREFFEHFLGWDLYLDGALARLVRREAHNKGLSPRQRHLFDLTGRDERVLFVLLLEFQELEADRQGIDWSSDERLRFVLRDLVDHVFERHRTAMPLDGKGEARVLATMRDLFRKLEAHRFLLRVEGPRDEEDFGGDSSRHALYECLPGLRCYRAEAVETSRLAAAYQAPEASPTSVEEEPGESP